MTSRPEGIRKQDLRDFTLQIRSRHGEVVGVGLLVSETGLVATCTHVVRNAVGDAALSTGVAIDIHFPAVGGQVSEDHRAYLIWWSDENSDDAALLQTESRQVPRTSAQVAILGAAAESGNHAFQSYGYAVRGLYGSGYVEGRILGPVEPPRERRPTCDPIELRAEHIRPGVSGGAVLDIERNLVVGLLVERWPFVPPADSRVAWAVDATVFARAPFGIIVHKSPEPLRAGIQPWRVGPIPRLQQNQPDWLHGAPCPLVGWAGREELLDSLTADWLAPACRLTGLIGLGGQGKSSVVRHWIDQLEGQAELRPDGIFWWSFYDHPDVETFFAAALRWIAFGVFDTQQYPSATARAHLVAAHLASGRYVFVLDGVEVLQFQEAERFGNFAVESFRIFLGFVAAPGHQSFAVLTSRTPPLDLVAFATYRQRVVDGLTPVEGRTLLRGLGVNGPDTVLESISEEWGGHALTLSLLGTYIATRHSGEAIRMEPHVRPVIGEPHYARIRRVLLHYDSLLDESERLILEVTSALRRSVGRGALRALIPGFIAVPRIQDQTNSLAEFDFDTLVPRLVQYRLLSYDASTEHYTFHPLIRTHYAERLASRDPHDVCALHRAISAYYCTLIDELPDQPTLEDFVPFVEAVHHACRAKDYDHAYELFWRGAPEGEHQLTQMLGAYHVQLSLMREFFPDQDVAREPLVTSPDAARFILHEVGFCLRALGRLVDSEPFFERAYALATQLGDAINASIIRANQAGLSEDLGDLARGVRFALEAVEAARRARLLPLRHDPADVLEYERGALLKLARLAELTGSGMAGRLYLQAVAIYGGRIPYVDASYVDFLRRIGQISMAREAVAKRALELGRYLDEKSMTERLLGDLDAGAKRPQQAHVHYSLAISYAQRIDRRDVLLEALIARGKFAAQRGDVELARSDLHTALREATACSFRLYEADIHLALAITYRAAGELDAARREAVHTRRMSAEMDYYWGEANAADLLRQLADPDGRSDAADRTRLFQELQRELEEANVGVPQDTGGQLAAAHAVLAPFFEYPERLQQVVSTAGLTYETAFLRRHPDCGAVVQEILTEFRAARDSDPTRCFAVWSAWMQPLDVAIRVIADLASESIEGESRLTAQDPLSIVRTIAHIVEFSVQPFARFRLEMRGLAGMRAPNAAGAAALSAEEVIGEVSRGAEEEELYKPSLLLNFLGIHGEHPRTGMCALVDGTIRCSRGAVPSESWPWSCQVSDLPGIASFVDNLFYMHKAAFEIFTADNLQDLLPYVPDLQITEHTADSTLTYSLVNAGFRIEKATRSGGKWRLTLNDLHTRGERAVKAALQEAIMPYMRLTGPVEVRALVRSGKVTFDIGFRTRLRSKKSDVLAQLFDGAIHLP